MTFAANIWPYKQYLLAYINAHSGPQITSFGASLDQKNILFFFHWFVNSTVEISVVEKWSIEFSKNYLLCVLYQNKYCAPYFLVLRPYSSKNENLDFPILRIFQYFKLSSRYHNLIPNNWKFLEVCRFVSYCPTYKFSSHEMAPFQSSINYSQH